MSYAFFTSTIIQPCMEHACLIWSEYNHPIFGHKSRALQLSSFTISPTVDVAHCPIILTLSLHTSLYPTPTTDVATSEERHTSSLTRRAEHCKGTPIILCGFQVTELALKETNQVKRVAPMTGSDNPFVRGNRAQGSWHCFSDSSMTTVTYKQEGDPSKSTTFPSSTKRAGEGWSLPSAPWWSESSECLRSARPGSLLSPP